MYEHVNIRRSQQSKAWVCGRSLAGIVGSNPAGVSSECCVLSEISASGWSLVQRSPTDCGASKSDHEASIMRRLWPTGSCCTMGGGYIHLSSHSQLEYPCSDENSNLCDLHTNILTTFINVTHKRMQNTLDSVLQYSEVHYHSFRPRCFTCAMPSPGWTLNTDYPLLREKFL